MSNFVKSQLSIQFDFQIIFHSFNIYIISYSMKEVVTELLQFGYKMITVFVKYTSKIDKYLTFFQYQC